MQHRHYIPFLLALGSFVLLTPATGCSQSSCENFLELTGFFDEVDFDDIDDFDDLDDLDDDFDDLIDSDDLNDAGENICEDFFGD